jgi:hypothetical protein
MVPLRRPPICIRFLPRKFFFCGFMLAPFDGFLDHELQSFAIHYDLERCGIGTRPLECIFGLIKGCKKSIEYTEGTRQRSSGKLNK